MKKSPTQILSVDVNQLLTECGWYVGRNVEGELNLPGDFILFPAAKHILTEFGNLKCGKRGAGIDRARSTINLNPLLAAGESDRFEDFERQVGARLYPLGEVDDGHFFLVVDEEGRVFLLMDNILFVADNFTNAIETLLLGKNAYPINECEWVYKGIEII